MRRCDSATTTSAMSSCTGWTCSIDTLQLEMARRLAGEPELFAAAAEQYLPVVDAVEDAAERQQVVGLLRRAADQARVPGNYALVNTLLVAALRLIEPGQTDLLVDVLTDRHAALYSIGSLEEADEEYRSIVRLSPTALQRADATSVQVHSLTHRNRLAEALRLGLDSLLELGIIVPPADRLPAELERQFDFLYRWLDQTTAVDDRTRPDLTDPTLLAATRLSLAVLPVTYFVADLPMYAWLSLDALRIWLDHGPGRTLVGPACHTAHAVAELRGDRAAAYEALQRIVALGEARGYEPEVARARFMAAVHSW